MIKVRIYRSKDGTVYGFDVENHGPKIVCAAVSVLVLNTVNCIEHFTKDKFECDYNEAGGMLRFRFPEGIGRDVSHDALLLTDSMIFGLRGIKAQYKNSLSIEEVGGSNAADI